MCLKKIGKIDSGTYGYLSPRTDISIEQPQPHLLFFEWIRKFITGEDVYINAVPSAYPVAASIGGEKLGAIPILLIH